MSHPVNTEWIEAAWEHFDGAIEEHNYLLAKDIIADTKDKGFGEGARLMEELLLQQPLSKFIIHPDRYPCNDEGMLQVDDHIFLK
jgi:hypothetical protein